MAATPKYVLSQNAYVFPSTRRASNQLTARLMSETSITGMINNFIDTDGYVITNFSQSQVGASGLDDPFEFNIFGYYFKVDKARSICNLFQTSNAIYAYIVLDKTGDYYELMGQDDDTSGSSYYQGVKFTDVDPSTDGTVYDKMLCIMAKPTGSSNWEVPENSKIRFISGFAFDIKEIDGGQI